MKPIFESVVCGVDGSPESLAAVQAARALGSVSERVAHEARSPVLVVR